MSKRSVVLSGIQYGLAAGLLAVSGLVAAAPAGDDPNQVIFAGAE